MSSSEKNLRVLIAKTISEGLTQRNLKELHLESLADAGLRGDLLSDLSDALSHVSWCLIGGMAVVLRGYRRTTDDIDIMVNATPDEFTRLSMYANSSGFKCGVSRTGTILRMTHKEMGAEVELLLATSPEQTQAVVRATPLPVMGYKIRVPQAIDLIALKVWTVSRVPNRANKDWGDVNGLMGTMSSEDLNILESDLLPTLPASTHRIFQAYLAAHRIRLE